MSKRDIVHIEIPSADFEQSGKFYAALFGWKITPRPELDYVLWEPPEGPGGGFSPLNDSKVGELLVHVASDDIQADLMRAVELGGKVIREKTEIPGIGWWGMFADPTGNRIAVYTSMNPQA
jgi:predicted enzyme related to lactoylglutathione lyase